ncbi:MAG TPA: DUF664 domain-containing protein [Acidimicrobiales bacterium]|nr:DUF664 domain-containing protein [Acidimicrobiales bacterium]
MTSAALLTDTFGRIRDVVHEAVEGLSVDDLMERLDAEANSIDWLVWHLTRVQDDHVAGVAGTPQVWTSAGWAKRCGLPFDESEHGYGHTSAQVAAVNLDAATLLGYHDAVYDATLTFVGALTDGDLDRIVDTAWDPPVTMGVRLVSVIVDSLQHAGQAGYIRGILARR